eukprot:6208867-Pleurochrysis_carterae.AAC.1
MAGFDCQRSFSDHVSPNASTYLMVLRVPCGLLLSHGVSCACAQARQIGAACLVASRSPQLPSST